MSKFFISFLIIFFATCRSEFQESGFSGENNRFFEAFYDLTNHPIDNEKKVVLSTIRKKLTIENEAVSEYLKRTLFVKERLSRLQSQDFRENDRLVEELRNLPNIGGIRLTKNGQTFFSYGDWTDHYSDGFSISKLKNSAQLIKLRNVDGVEAIFFLGNYHGYLPVDFSFVGYDSQFFLFQGDGTLRFANAEFVDYSVRHEHFRDYFQSAKKKYANSEILKYEDYTLYFFWGDTPFAYYIFLILRIILFFLFIGITFIFLRELKKYRDRSALSQEAKNQDLQRAKQILDIDYFKKEKVPSNRKTVKDPKGSANIKAENETEDLEESKHRSVENFIQDALHAKSNESNLKYSSIEKIS